MSSEPPAVRPTLSIVGKDRKSALPSAPAPTTVQGGAGPIDTTREHSAPGSESHDDDTKSPQATRLIALADEAELFHSPEGDAYVTFSSDGRWETAALRSKHFRSWLVQRFYASEKRAPASHALLDALGALEGTALHAAPCMPVHVRLAAYECACYLDLASARGEAVEIAPDGWRVVPVPPVRFRRPRGVAPLPVPVSGGRVEELRSFINLDATNDADWRLVVVWLLASLRPAGPYPILVLSGEAGAAKSTTARILRSLVDPSRAPLRAEPLGVRDLVISATNSWVLAYDNVSSLSPLLADALCRLATGGGLATRRLYTDSEEEIFDVQRPVILTGIGDLTTRGDLLDRAIILNLPPIPESDRRPESELWREIAAAQPRILGALLDALAVALAELPTTHLDRMPRMADFALLGSAAERGLGWPPGAFIEAYDRNRELVNESVLESTPIVVPLRDLAAGTVWEGTPTELLKELTRRADDAARQQRAWPKSPASLSGLLKRIAPNLRRSGLEVSFPQRTGRLRRIRLQGAGNSSSPSSPSSLRPMNDASVTPPGNGGKGSDGERVGQPTLGLPEDE